MLYFLPFAAWGSWGDAGLLQLCVSAGGSEAGAGEGCWAGDADICGDEGRLVWGVTCKGSAGGLGTGSKNKK